MQPEKQASFWWQYLKWPEIVERSKKCDIAILPLGAIEQHGHHLPTGHDTLQLFQMLEGVAQRTGAMLLPCPWYGAHPYHHYGFPGTIPLQNDTMRGLIKDVIRGAANAGYNKFVIFYGHGQAFVINYAVQELGMEGYFIVSVLFANLTKDIYGSMFQTPAWHADEFETSVALHLFPEYVDMSKARKEIVEGLISKSYIQGPMEAAQTKPCRFDEGTFASPEYMTHTIGSGGDPTLANAEKGRRYVEIVVERTAEFVKHIQDKYPPGVKPSVK